ncbi:hypothetical protein [Streptomyces sp. NBC_00091]|uniref:hypothetical protein n=1 Tax=Streptomyces sp. NBC_00091 TaxID=2975648 RepID=UPI0022504BC7|nr:hypothetical protein [Streptomyces sp. NBC_00091]MCX5377968.1 hypothetical protein [Streptomyces sp. NBC_00091]
MSVILPRALTPGPEFLREVRAVYRTGDNGNPHVMLGHPQAHQGERYLYGIAYGLGLRAGDAYPRTAHVLYYVRGTWALDYGHRDTLLRLPRPPRDWAVRTQATCRAHIGVCLDPYLLAPRPDRLLTGTVGYRADTRVGLL